MPKSKRRKQQRRPNSPAKVRGLELSSFAVAEENHDAFKKAMEAAAKRSVEEFPKRLAELQALSRDRSPPGIISVAAYYTLHGFVSSDGEFQRSPLGLEQHHIELLQAVLLTTPLAEWGAKPVTADIMQVVFSELPKLAETFLCQRLLAADKAKTEEERELLSLQERIRFHTQGVRNWGYFGDVVSISKEIYAPLDNAFAQRLGFGLTDLVDVMLAVLKEYERRISEHTGILAKVLRGRSVRQMVRLYFKYVPDLQGDPEDLLAGLPKGIGREGVMSFIMQHFDLRLTERSIFTPGEIARLSGRSEDVAGRVLKKLSIEPGGLAGVNPDYLFLSNPIWTAPGIDLGGAFLFAMPQVAFSHINSIVRNLAEAEGLAESLEQRRATYLEQKLEETIRVALPGAAISTGVEWELGGEQGETDLVAVLDRAVLIVEAKSHRLTPEGLRGAPDRVKRHIKDLVLKPSEQSVRVAEAISAAKNGDAEAQALMQRFQIDSQRIDHVIRLSVTLDDLSVLSTAEGDFKKVGWVPEDHHLAPTMLIADLVCVCDILDNPILLLHYLGERNYLQKSFNLLGDELDFLGLYLSTGFNIGGLEKQVSLFAPSGMSAPIDRYYEARDAGITIAKPRADLAPLYRSIVTRLADRRPDGWTSVGICLLSSGNPEEQRQGERMIDQLRVSLRKTRHEEDHNNSLVIRPPLPRKPLVVFYLFPERKRPTLKKDMEQLAYDVLDGSDHTACAVIARCVDNWDRVFEACLLAQP